MRWIGFALALTVMGAGTLGALVASARGAGLPGLLERPVSVRQSSVQRGRHGVGPAFIYFGSRRRRHYGGGYGYGK